MNKIKVNDTHHASRQTLYTFDLTVNKQLIGLAQHGTILHCSCGSRV